MPKPRSRRLFTVGRMARELGKDWQWVKRRIPLTGYQPLRRKASNNVYRLMYPTDCLEALRDLLEQEARVHPAESQWLTLDQLAKATHRSTVWIRNRLAILGVKPEKRMSKIGRVAEYYPPTLLERLRQMAREYPPAERWLTINQLAQQLNVDREWVSRRLELWGIQSQLRWQPASGKVAAHYPPEVFAWLEPEMQYLSQAEGWKTANELTVVLQRSDNWVRHRLNKFADTAELRRDSHGNARWHYPPSVMHSLQQQRDSLVLMRPLRELLIAARKQHHFRWVDLLRLAKEPNRIADVLKLKLISIDRAIRIARALAIFAPSSADSINRYTAKLKAQAVASELEQLAPRWLRALSYKRHRLKLWQEDEWHFAACDPCGWSSEEGVLSEEAAKLSFVEHVESYLHNRQAKADKHVQG